LVFVVALLLFIIVLVAGASGWTFVAATALLWAVLLLWRRWRPPRR
jgi:hypothetical protein